MSPPAHVPLLHHVLLVVLGELSPVDFTRWLHATPALEDALGWEVHLSLLEIDAAGSWGRHELRKWLIGVIGRPSYERRRLMHLLGHVATWDDHAMTSLEALYESYVGGVEWLRPLAGLAGEAESHRMGWPCYVDWSSDETVSRARSDAARLLASLTSGALSLGTPRESGSFATTEAARWGGADGASRSRH